MFKKRFLSFYIFFLVSFMKKNFLPLSLLYFISRYFVLYKSSIFFWNYKSFFLLRQIVPLVYFIKIKKGIISRGERNRNCQLIKKAFVYQTLKCLFFSFMETQSNKKIIMKIKTEKISKLLTWKKASVILFWIQLLYWSSRKVFKNISIIIYKSCSLLALIEI